MTRPAVRGPRKTFLIISQVYVPDPAAVGQHMADAASELARRGHRVVVFTSARGYDDPWLCYAARESRNGVEIRRFPLASFGKASIPLRLLAGLFFVLQAIAYGLFVRGLDTVVVSTSPPIAPIVALILQALRGTRIKFWVMDLNPDQMIALGKIGPRSIFARVFDALNRAILRRAEDVIALDRFMAARLNRKLDVGGKLTVLPPWPLDDEHGTIDHRENPFRRRHGLDGRFVVMYSGNHGPSSPIGTILEAARRLQDEPELIFLFVGGGIGKREVEEAASHCPNIRSLPYQPLDELKYSLSAADVHLVTVGDGVVGINHPSKVYGAMAVDRPILLIGPTECHVADMIREADIGWHIPHGDAGRAERVLREIRRTDPCQLAAKGARARKLVESRFSKAALLGALCNVLEPSDS